MAPPAFLASTPSSRRTRRKLQKQRKRARQSQDGNYLGPVKSNLPSNEHRDWHSTAHAAEHNAVAAFSLPQTHKFEPELKTDFESTPNPFSLLDVHIPSPTLSVPLSPPVGSTQRPPYSGHDVYGIGYGSLPTPPPEAVTHKRFRQDE
ncbi:hypothetical protein OHC33_003652 [Knufia fluminis]|uniref:Uncharacterized protein n=1 Tax=Knufia fluminis TaxID=191047 RepID=A0AAN8F279_9EURO|nr:hypothetical protein OHC33_003652 [Knufia fluminis]